MKKKTLPPQKPRIRKLTPPQRAQPKQRVLRPQPPSLPRQVIPVPEESIEKMLMKMILNTVELKSEVDRHEVKSNPFGILKQTREGMFVDPQTGAQHRSKQNIKYVATYKDGTPAGDSGLVKCQNCGEIVSVENLERCPCGKTVCIICGIYIEKYDCWFCCRKHAVFGGTLGINLRFFTQKKPKIYK
jgi:hypothetical protein